MFEFLALLEAEALHDFRHPIGCAEVAHEIVLEANVEPGRARVALAGATPAELPIDASRFVTLCADDVEATFVRNAGSKFNVSAAAGHISRNGDGARLARATNDFGLLPMIFRVQHGVRNFLALQHSGEQLGSFHAHRADEDRLRGGMALADFVDHGVVFFAARLVDAVVGVGSRDWPIRRDDGDVQFVDVVKLVRLRLGCARHAGKLVVEPEIILNRDRGEGLGFTIDLDAFLRFDGLVQSIAPATPRHFAAGVFVDDDDFVFLDDVSDVLLEKTIGPQEL